MAKGEKKGNLDDTDDRALLSGGETETGSVGDLSGLDGNKGQGGNVEDLSDVNLDNSGSGLLDLSLEPGDTRLGDVIDDIYPDLGEGGVEIQPSGAPSKKALQARASLEKRVYHHDDIMAGERFKKVRDYCYTDGVKYILFAKDKDGQPNIFVMWGYSLKEFVSPGKTMREIQFVDEAKKAMNSYNFFDQLAARYFGVDGKKGEVIAPDNKYSRVAFGYSVRYNPDDKENLKAKIKGTINDANEVYGKMKSDMGERLGGGKAITRISGDVTFNLCTWACGVYRQKKAEPLELTDEGVKPDSLTSRESPKKKKTNR